MYVKPGLAGQPETAERKRGLTGKGIGLRCPRRRESMSEKEKIEVCEEYCIHDHITRQEIPSEEEIYRMAELFKTFGDATRIRILTALSKQELCVCDIADLLGMSQSAISHQLRVLKQQELVHFRREGKTVFYSLADAHVSTILAQGLQHVNE